MICTELRMHRIPKEAQSVNILVKVIKNNQLFLSILLFQQKINRINSIVKCLNITLAESHFDMLEENAFKLVKRMIAFLM